MKLHKCNKTYWITTDLGSFECLTRGFARKALRTHGVRDEEIDIAFDELILKRHTTAHFGIDGYFLFTSNHTNVKQLAA